MKIEFQLTVKLSPESKGEQIDTFGAEVRALQADINKLIEGNQLIGLPPKQTQVRFLVHTAPILAVAE